MNKCKVCDSELTKGNCIRPDEMTVCHRCAGILSKRTEVATAIAAQAFPYVQFIDRERAERYVRAADELILALCRVRP